MEKPNFKHVCFLHMQKLTNFPYIEADFDALTNYELLCKVVEYLNKVIANENEQNESIIELYNGFNSLKSYVENYFDNLDVQEEINNKLDDMARDGSLTNLIKDYIDPLFDNLEEQVQDEIAYIDNKVNNIASGSPLPASSTSEMTDTSRIYVNTTNGYWYYYDGDSWEQEGVYQASVNDKFLANNSTNAVQNKTLYNALSETLYINNDTNEINSLVEITKTSGYITLNGTSYESDTYEYTNKISVKAGDVITAISSTGDPVTIRFLTAYNGDTAVEESGDTNITSYTVPNGINGIIVSCAVSMNLIGINKNYNEETQTYINKMFNIDDFDTYQYLLVNISYTEGKYITANGTVYDNDLYGYSQKFSVKKDDIISTISNNSTYIKPRFICAYLGNNVNEVAGSNNPDNTYTVPDGVNKLIFTYALLGEISYILIKRPISKIKKEYINSNLGYMSWKGNLDPEDEIKLNYTNVRYNTVISFKSKITDFNKITIGFTDAGNTFHELCYIDNTNLHYLETTSDYTTVNHGLTIDNDLCISIQNNVNIDRVNLLEDIQIFSNGNLFSTKESNINAYCSEFFGKLTIIIDSNTTLTNCELSYSMKDIDKPIWLFGDSWLSIYNKRYTYYLAKNNQLNNCMINAYAGENSNNGLTALKELIKLRIPKILIWTYGMNDKDNSNGVNVQWLQSLDDVIEICDNNHIELILTTIPNTPTIINTYKNNIVKSLGYRYFDEVKAVCDSNGEWYSGYQAQDGNHPTNKGALALYYQFLCDVPEIGNY